MSSAMRSSGEIRLFSIEYLANSVPAMASAMAPSHAAPRTPSSFSTSKAGPVAGAGAGGNRTGGGSTKGSPGDGAGAGSTGAEADTGWTSSELDGGYVGVSAE